MSCSWTLILLFSWFFAINCGLNICLVLRDIKERGRTIDSVLTQYHRFVKKSFEEFVHPVRDNSPLNFCIITPIDLEIC